MTEDQKSDSELEWIALIKKGDDHAFEKLFHEYYFPLTRFACRYTESIAIAEELVQDLFLEIWEQRETWTPFGKLRPCLYRIIKQKSLNHLKHQKVKRRYDSQWMNDWTNPTYISEDSDSEEQLKSLVESLNKLVEQLPHRSKMIYKLHKNDGLTYSEIAEVMEISKKTVESQMSRALKFLREKLVNVMLLFIVSLLF